MRYIVLVLIVLTVLLVGCDVGPTNPTPTPVVIVVTATRDSLLGPAEATVDAVLTQAATQIPPGLMDSLRTAVAATLTAEATRTPLP